MDPKISLGINNCFAIKRWTAPDDWARVIKDLGLKYIECVTVLENEPFLMPKDYLQEWADKVNEAQARHGVDVVIVYSDNSTYDTIGLAHPDSRVRTHIIENWFGSSFWMAKAIGAGFGYFVHAFPENILFNREKYDLAYNHMQDSCVRVNRLAAEIGLKNVALEQMYTPHQVPYTIDGMRDLMKAVTRDSSYPLYLTEDVGHHCQLYLRPDDEKLCASFARYKKDGYVDLWLGSKEAYELFTEAKGETLSQDTIKALMEDIDNNEHLFNEPRDTDCYSWLRELGCYSTSVHLQQTDGNRSAHAHFTSEQNEKGIIHPVKILRALDECYRRSEEKDMPPRLNHIYLMFELYIKTIEIGYQGLYNIGQSVDYFRKFIPRDDMYLSELIDWNKDVVV